MKSYIIKGIFGAIVLWFLFLGVLSVLPVQNTNHMGEDGFQQSQENSVELLKRMEVALQQIQVLKKNNLEMKRILGDAHPNAVNTLDLSKGINTNGEVKENTPQVGDPSYAYEKTRRQVELDMKELWYTIRGHASSIGNPDYDQIRDIYR